MSGDIATNFNTPGAADAALHSPDGWIRANKVEIDIDQQEVRFYMDYTYLGKIAFTGRLHKGELLHINFDTGFVVRPS